MDAPPPPAGKVGDILSKPNQKLWQKESTKYGGKCIDAMPSLKKMISDV
jgi:hypothetical protein